MPRSECLAEKAQLYWDGIPGADVHEYVTPSRGIEAVEQDDL